MEGDKKLMIIFGLITVAIIGFGAYFLTRTPNTPTPSAGPKVNEKLLSNSKSHKIQAPQEKAVLVEFGDYECPACGSYYPLIKQLTQDYKDNLSVVFRNFPLTQHQNARPAAYAAEAAGLQGKYWEMHDRLYTTQAAWSESSTASTIFEGYAKSLGLDMDKYKKDVVSSEVKKLVDDDLADGNTLGVDSTPSFYLNGSKLQNPRSYADFQTLVKAAFLSAPVSVTGGQEFHAHFDLSVVLNGKAIDFTQTKYQSTEANELDPYIHMHDGNGKVVHLHKEGVNLNEFFTSLKITFTKDCFDLDTGVKYCNLGTKTLKMYVNGKENTDFANYVPQDLDRILITYGSETQAQVQKQIDNVSDDACIYSEKCPERGKPPTENCVGGLGTGCDQSN